MFLYGQKKNACATWFHDHMWRHFGRPQKKNDEAAMTAHDNPSLVFFLCSFSCPPRFLWLSSLLYSRLGQRGVPNDRNLIIVRPRLLRSRSMILWCAYPMGYTRRFINHFCFIPFFFSFLILCVCVCVYSNTHTAGLYTIDILIHHQPVCCLCSDARNERGRSYKTKRWIIFPTVSTKYEWIEYVNCRRRPVESLLSSSRAKYTHTHTHIREWFVVW